MNDQDAQSKAGIPEKRRGQQMGDGANPDQNLAAEEDTPATSGRRPEANAMFADESSNQFSSDSSRPDTVSPSTPAAIPTGTPLGQSNAEKAFKERHSKN